MRAPGISPSLHLLPQPSPLGDRNLREPNGRTGRSTLLRVTGGGRSGSSMWSQLGRNEVEILNITSFEHLNRVKSWLYANFLCSFFFPRSWEYFSCFFMCLDPNLRESGAWWTWEERLRSIYAVLYWLRWMWMHMQSKIIYSAWGILNKPPLCRCDNSRFYYKPIMPCKI